MKKLLTIILVLFVLITLSHAQVTTVQNGKWYYTSTWSTGVVPDSTDNVIIKHDINIDCSGMCNNLTIDAGARIHNGTVTVYGALNNNGTINGVGEWNGMKLWLKGDLTNYGLYNATTYFTGVADQTIKSSDTLFMDYTHDRNLNSKIILDGKIIIKNTNFFLHESELEFSDTLKIINSTLDGGIIDGNNSVLLGLGYGNEIGWDAAGSFDPAYTELRNLKLEGIHYIYGNGEVKNAWALGIGENVINNGTITNSYQHTGGYAKVHILKDFINNGIIQEVQDGLYLNVDNSDFTNNGSLNIISIMFNGNCEFSSVDSVALGAFGAVDSNTIVTITSDVIFKDRTVDVNFNGGKLILPSNSLFYTTYNWYNQLRNIYVEANNSEIAFAHVAENTVINNPNIRYLAFAYDSRLLGEIKVGENGTFPAYASSYPRVTIEGNITNYGTIRNHSSSGSLYLDITGNILHDGNSWENLETKLIGTKDQNISIPNDSSWTGKVIFDAMLTGTSYQWKKDGVDISSATSKEYILSNGIQQTHYGEYQCVVDGNNSRKIIIGNAIPSTTFKITDVVITNLNATQTKVEWKTTKPASGFIFYAREDTSSGFPMEAMESGGNVTEHSIILDSLSTDSIYYFIIDQNDADWNIVRSGTYSFVAGDVKDTSFVGTFTKLTNTPDEDVSHYYGGSFISKDVAYVVTNHNRLFKTSDGGDSWTDISPEQGTDYDKIGNCPKVHFINENIGTVAFSVDDGANGYNYDLVFGYVWCTTDGGATWSERFDVNEDQILHLEQATENVVYVSGTSKLGVSSYRWFKKITRNTTTGIYTLSDITTTPSNRPHVVGGDWLNYDIGVVIGKQNVEPYSANIFRTTNGGSSWINISSSLSINGPQVSFSDNSIQIINENRIVLAYYEYINSTYETRMYYSENNGTLWTRGNFSVEPFALTSLSFEPAGQNGIICGYSPTDSSKLFYSTTDGGANWSPYILPEVSNGITLYANQITPDGTIWIIGSNNSIWKSGERESNIEIETKSEIPSEFTLSQNYPNPFNPITNISYSLPTHSNVKLTIYNIAGQVVDVLVDNEQSSGNHIIQWNASDVVSGIYLYHIQADGFNQVKKCILLK